MWEEEEKDTSPSPPSSSTVSNTNTVSNDQTPPNEEERKQAMGIEEETPLDTSTILSDGRDEGEGIPDTECFVCKEGGGKSLRYFPWTHMAHLLIRVCICYRPRLL